MNKILSNALFYGAAILIGSSLGTAVSLSRSNVETTPKEEVAEEIIGSILTKNEVNELSEKDVNQVSRQSVKYENKNENKAAKVEEKSWEKPATTDKKETTTQVKSNANFSISTYADYEVTILGSCPSQRDKSNKWEEGNRLNAIGIITSGDNPTSSIYSLNHRIETWWNSYKVGTLPNTTYLGRYMMASLNNISDFDNTYANSRVAMYIDFNGLFVNWDNSWQDGKSITINEAQRQKLDQMASDATNYLRWLDVTYNAKCPND